MNDSKEKLLLEFLKNHNNCSSKEIYEEFSDLMSYATVKRTIANLMKKKLISNIGTGKNSKYQISKYYSLFQPIDIKKYYEKEIDERQIINNFNFELINEIFDNVSIFNDNELERLNKLQNSYQNNISQLSSLQYSKELERLAIDLSWKSSQIEGNTYSLLETERLLKEKETASGKTKEEAIMLLNHKDAIDYIVENPDFFNILTVPKIEFIHSILAKELNIEMNLRKRRVGITGTNYSPIDNEFQIKEALIEMCNLINKKDNTFEKSLLALLIISYIQPFSDGNKRTARIVSNAILINFGSCPISFRTVDSIDYKKAMLIFYEQNNINAFKEIFIEQFEFAVNTYF